MPKVKARDYRSLEKLIKASYDTNPLHPEDPIITDLTPAEEEGIAKGYGEFGYPIIEPIARRPHLVKLLINKKGGVKYEATEMTRLLIALRVFEESGNRPLNCLIRAATLINSPYTSYGTVTAATQDMAQVKRILTQLYGWSLSKVSYLVRIVQVDEYYKTKEYHQLNVIKTGHRAALLNSMAYTRRMMGDPDTGTVASDVIDLAIKGREAYDERYHQATPKPEILGSRLPRHLS